MTGERGLDVVYIAASARDARFTRLCVASIRYFYPDAAIELIVGGPLQPGLVEELQRHWNVGVANLPAGDYGWGFIKLEPLFLPPGKRFLVLDSDTVIAGPVLDWVAKYDDAFIVVDEKETQEVVKSIYFDWTKATKNGITPREPDFVFNSGQWFGRSGIIKREDFAGLVQFGSPTKLVDPTVFKNGEQGVLNFVLNDKARMGVLSVARVPLMHWPGVGMNGLNAKMVAAKEAPPVVVHWAGMKKARLSAMVGADLLTFFEKCYYQRIPGGEAARLYAGIRHALSHWLNEIRIRFRFRMKMIRAHYSVR